MQPHLLDRKAVVEFFGGIHPSTLYRGARLGRYPRPIKVGPGSSRWLLTECQAALTTMTEGRGRWPLPPIWNRRNKLPRRACLSTRLIPSPENSRWCQTKTS